MLKIGVVGGGSWSTAIVKVLLENVSQLTWWVRNESIRNHIIKNKSNPNYLSYVSLDTSKLNIVTDLNELVRCSDYIIFVLPSKFIRDVLKTLEVNLEGKFILSAIKGMVPEGNKTVSSLFMDEYGVREENMAIIGGPTHSEDVVMGHISYIMIAGKNKGKIDKVSSCLACDYIKVSYSNDLEGIEYAMIVKNLYAILSGIINGLDYGDNFLSVVVSNCIREMKLFLNKVCNLDPDIIKTQYIGDLLVTCYSSFSRNRVFGNLIGKGYSVMSVKSEMNMIAEGYYAIDTIYKKALEKGIECKLINTIHNIIIKSKNPKMEIHKLSKQLD